MPAAKIFVDGFDVAEDRGIGGEVFKHRSLVFVIDAERNLGECVEHVDFHDRHRIERIDQGRVAGCGPVEPAAPPGPAGG